MFGTPQQQQHQSYGHGQGSHPFQASQNTSFGGQNLFSSSASQPNLFASTGSAGNMNYSPAAGAGGPQTGGASLGYGQQFGTPQGQNFGLSQSGGGVGGYQTGFNQSPGAFGGPQPAASGPRYMPGYLMKQATPSRPQSHSFGHSLTHSASAEDMANTSMDREVNSNSPPHTRGSIFGSATASRTSGSLFNKKGSSHTAHSMDDDVPPIQSLDDMDELPSAAGSTLSPPKLPRTLSSSPNDSGASAMHQAAAGGFQSNNSNSASSSRSADVPKLIIFGFQRSALPQVIEHLSLIGPIVSVETSPNPSANWATITFQEAWQAARAIRRNGELIQNGALMIGVKWADPSRADASSFSISPTNSLAPSSSSSQFPLATTASKSSAAMSAKPPGGLPSTPVHAAHAAPPTVGSPVPILGSAYKAQNSHHQSTPSRWSLGGLIGGGGPQNAAGADGTVANNPFAVPQAQQQQQQTQQQSGMWSKVSDAIFGF